TAKMWRLPTVFALLQIVSATCPEPFNLVKDGECRGLGGRNTSYFADAASIAIETCTGEGGKPMIFHDEEHQRYWRQEKEAPLEDGYMIMGLVCNTASSKWEWSDGSAVDYKPTQQYYDPALNKACTSGSSWYYHPNSSWLLGTTGTIKTVNFCTIQLQQPTPEEAGCDEDDEVCYPIVPAGENWQDGEDSCMRFDANLASIHNKQENTFVRRQAVAYGAVNGVFIGAKADKDGAFQWIDGTKMDYQNWAPGFPKKNFGDCIALDSASTSGQWMNFDCNAKLPVACMIKKGDDAVPTCTGQEYEQGAIITSPGYPFSASTPCDYFLEVPEGKQLELQILSLEANECCDVLVLHDAYLGGREIARVSGALYDRTSWMNTFHSGTNLMRVSWLPGGGVNVRGVMMTYRAV
ncbi:hypothetical protein PMAYCL1PPCAC_21761, partial [Pristionchus mayeri]